jgi:hypothetical protein
MSEMKLTEKVDNYVKENNIEMGAEAETEQKLDQNNNDNNHIAGRAEVYMVKDEDYANTVGIGNTQENSNNRTIRDYINYTFDQKLTIDSRSFIKYFWDNLASTHILLICFYKKSLLLPPWVRFNLFALYMNFLFLLNCMFYTDDYIDKRTDYYSEVIYNV